MNAGLDPHDALDLLGAAPGTKQEKQSFFNNEFDVRVPRTNYDLMWDRLVDELGGEDEAADAVAALVLSADESRAIQLLSRAAMGRPVNLRMQETALVDLLFEADDELTAAGEALADRLREAQTVAPRTALVQSIAPAAKPPARRTPVSTEGADVVLHWRRADPENPRLAPWPWSNCLYAYLHPATAEVLYVGKTDFLTVRQRFVSNFKRKFHDLYARHNLLKVDVIAAHVELFVSARLTQQWLDDLESLLIQRLQPRLNVSKRKSRSNTRPGTVVVCIGEWPADAARFVDKG